MADISVSVSPITIISIINPISINNDMRVNVSKLVFKAKMNQVQHSFKIKQKEANSIEVDVIYNVYETGVDQVQSIVDTFPDYSLDSIDPKYPKWNSFSFKFEKGTDAVMKMKSWTDKTRKVLNATKTLINKVRGVISLLNNLLDFYQDTFKAFIKIFIKQLDRLITDVKSTGIYFLDMTTYHFDALSEESNERGFYGAWWDDLSDTEAVANKLKEIESKDITKNNTKEIMQEVLSDVFKYKTETYQEYIEKICSHFTNPNDVVAYEDINTPLSASFTKRTPWGVFSKDGVSGFRTGAPNFGPNGKMKVIILTAAFPDITKLFDFLVIICGGKSEKGKITLSEDNGLIGEMIGGLKDVVEKTADVYNFVKDKSVLDYVDINRNGKYTPPVQETIYPYWLGFTLGNLFPYVFDRIDDALGWLNGLSFSVDRGLLDTVEATLKSVVEEIDKLLRLIDVIDQILDFINALFNVPTIGMLHLDVNGGTENAVKMIRESVGFFANAEKDIKEVSNIQNKFLDKLTKQKYEYEYYNSVQKRTDLTAKAINQLFTLWQERYDIIIDMYNYTIQHNFIGLYNDLYKDVDFINYTAQIKNSIDPVEINQLKLLRNQLDCVIIWNNEFNVLKGLWNKLKWPKTEDGKNNNIKNENLIDALLSNEYEKQYSKEVILYNKKIETLINNGYEAINNDISFLLNMIKKLDKESLYIYSKDDNTSRLLLYKSMLNDNKADAIAYVKDVIDNNEDNINTNKQVANLFDPDEKMFFAGMVFVAGIPNILNTNNFFNRLDFETATGSDENYDWTCSEIETFLDDLTKKNLSDFLCVKEITKFVCDRTTYKTDFDSTGKPEFYQLPEDTYSKGTGDCEDYHIFIMYLIYKHLGIKGEIVSLRKKLNLNGHAVLSIPFQNATGELIIDYKSVVDSFDKMKNGYSKDDIQKRQSFGEVIWKGKRQKADSINNAVIEEKYFNFDEFNKNIIDQNAEYKAEWKKQKNDINKAWDALSDFFN